MAGISRHSADAAGESEVHSTTYLHFVLEYKFFHLMQFHNSIFSREKYGINADIICDRAIQNDMKNLVLLY